MTNATLQAKQAKGLAQNLKLTADLYCVGSIDRQEFDIRMRETWDRADELGLMGKAMKLIDPFGGARQ